MQIKKKPTAIVLATLYCIWTVVVQPIWNLNLERAAEKGQIDTALSGGRVMDFLSTAASYVPSSFALGFVTGAMIFAYWDVLVPAFRRHILRRKPEARLEAEYDIRAWVGNMVPYFDLKKYGCAQILIKLIGVGDTPFRVSKVEGHIKFRYDPGNGKYKKIALPTPAISENPTTDGPMRAGHYGWLTLVQNFPADVAEAIPETFGWKPQPGFDFEELNIVLVSEDGMAGKRLKIWESMRLTAGEGEVRAVETSRLFKSDEEREKFTAAWDKVAHLFKPGRD